MRMAVGCSFKKADFSGQERYLAGKPSGSIVQTLGRRKVWHRKSFVEVIRSPVLGKEGAVVAVRMTRDSGEQSGLSHESTN